MLLGGRSVVPQFSIRSNRAVAWRAARRRRSPVLCISRSSSPCCLGTCNLDEVKFYYQETKTFIMSNERKNTEIQHRDHFQNSRNSSISVSSISKHPKLAFDRLQPCDEELSKGQKRSFGRFVAREVLLDEEYWSASWLRAEAHWESVSYMRHVDNYKRKYAEQEFYALKRRCTGRDGNSLKCVCLVTVKKEDPNVRRTVLNSVVGTLDLSNRQFLQGETFPGEFTKPSGALANVHFDAHRYAYIANLCVSKFARRQGIASNMLNLASDVAVSSGMKQLFVHVNVDNRSAQDLYKKTGFEIVEAASSPLSKDQRVLMCMEL